MDRSGGQGARTPQLPGACKSCNKLGYWAQDYKVNPPEGSAALASKLKQLRKEKAHLCLSQRH